MPILDSWTGALSREKCHKPNLKSAGLFPRNLSSWTPLKPQYSNPNPLTIQLWCSDFLTPPTPLIIPHRLPYSSHTSHHPSQTPCLPWISYATQKLMLDSCKMVEKHFEAFHTFLWHFFQVLNTIFYAYRSSKVSSRPDCIFEIHLLWQSGFSRVYSNSCCSSSFEPEIIKKRCITITYWIFKGLQQF